VVRAITPLTDADAATLDSWRYEPPYDFYNGEDEPVRNPERFHAVRDEGDIVGFYYFQEKGDAVEIGLGLRPDLTGRGHGLGFVRDGIALARRLFGERQLILNVAAFNERAIGLYERAGFVRTGSHVRTFEHWGDVPFVEMKERR
jgi:ribosomal-protein-alanine N-acetyltransferase